MFINRLVLLFFLVNISHLYSALPTIALIPYGDSKNIGHSLQGGYERTACHLFAQKLKEELESEGICHVLITHSAQEKVEPYHIASTVNQHKVAAAIALSFYPSKTVGLQSDIFFRSTNNLITTHAYKNDPLSIIPADQSHLVSIDENKRLCDTIAGVFRDDKNKKTFTCNHPLSLPLIALNGITMPSMVMSGGVHEFGQYSLFIHPLVEGLRRYLSREPLKKS